MFLISGEPSGDAHGAALIAGLKRLHPELQFVGLGGEKMAAAGMEMLYNLPHRMAIMGFWKVLGALPRIGRLLDLLRRYLQDHPPDLVIVIDYPGFNTQAAAICQRQGIPVVYYITPQVWAWAKWRVARLGRLTRLLLVILPFEREIYERAGIPVRYVGHPLCEELDAVPSLPLLEGERRVLGLLPGSRSAEIKGVLPVMLKAARLILEALAERGEAAPRLVLACAKPKHRARVERLVAASGLEVEILDGQAHPLMKQAHLCLVTSGTATLETALLGTPMVIVYRISWLALAAVRSVPFLETDHIGLANIIAGEGVVPELLFAGDKSRRICELALPLWSGPERETCLAGLARVKDKLTTDKPASEAAAEAIVELMAELEA